MPSRKKAQGKARKAEKEWKAGADAFQWCTKLNPGNNSGCGHVDPPGRFTEDDVIECDSVVKKMAAEYKGLMNYCHDIKRSLDLMQEIIDPYQNTYRKEIRGNAVKMGIFRALCLSWGTEYALKEIQDHETDLLAWKKVELLPLPFLRILLTTEELGKHGGTKSGMQSWDNVAAVMNDMNMCPREAIKFFHRRNGCDCLKEIYYKLKDSTKRKSSCHKCEVVKEVGHFYRCGRCNYTQYCSRECAAADKEDHRRVCHLLAPKA